MNDEVKHFVGKICKCVKDKRPVRLLQAPQKSITSSAPMELVGLDFLHLDTCVGGFQYLLVITDHFTRYSQVYPTRNKEAKTAADKLFNDYILRFGMPGKIIHDQGREFENKLFHQLSRSCNIKRLRTTPYHPQCNGQVERMNQSIISMLKTLEKELEEPHQQTRTCLQLHKKVKYRVCTILSFVWSKTTFADRFNTVSN